MKLRKIQIWSVLFSLLFAIIAIRINIYEGNLSDSGIKKNNFNFYVDCLSRIIGKNVSSADPEDVLVQSTYVGGAASSEYAYGIFVDDTGCAYITGETYSNNFYCTPGAYDTTFGGDRDIFVCKLNAEGTDLIYSTYIGGTYMDYAQDIVVDSDGCAYIVGTTDSGGAGFPTTPNCYDNTELNYDAFALKLSADGTELLNSTFIGGSGNDYGKGIDIDSSNRPVVIGYTTSASTSFPQSSGAYQTSRPGSFAVFVTKLNEDMSDIEFSTFFGGGDYDYGHSIAFDEINTVYFTGYTRSSDFPKTTGAYDEGKSGTWDAFVSRLSADGTTLLNSTFLGGPGDEVGKDLKIANNSVFITGYTDAQGFPTSIDAYDRDYNGGSEDVFVVKFNSTLTTLEYGTLLGGAGMDKGTSIVIDSKGYACITGETTSNPFNTTSNAYSSTYLGGGDIFISRLGPNGTMLDYSTYFGTGAENDGYSIALDNSDSLYITGFSWGGLPTTPGAFNETVNGGRDAYISKFKIPYWSEPEENGGENTDENGGSPPGGIPGYPLEYLTLIPLILGFLFLRNKKNRT